MVKLLPKGLYDEDMLSIQTEYVLTHFISLTHPLTHSHIHSPA